MGETARFWLALLPLASREEGGHGYGIVPLAPQCSLPTDLVGKRTRMAAEAPRAFRMAGRGLAARRGL